MIRRIIYILIIILIEISSLSAQEGLSISKIFDGRYKKQQNATEVLVKGRKLQPYNLTLFRSITIKDSPADFKVIEELVRQDSEKALDKDIGKIGGEIYYGFYQLPIRNDRYRYLFYRNNSIRDPKDKEITVVYMEGNTTIEELKKMFK